MSEPDWPDVSTYDRNYQIGRSNWQVGFDAADVRAAAQHASAYHRRRVLEWQQEAIVTKDKIHESGIEVRDQQVTGGVRHDVVLDSSLAARLGECESKQREHGQKADALDRWTTFLAAAVGQLTLTSSDADFFEIGEHDSEPLTTAAPGQPA